MHPKKKLRNTRTEKRRCVEKKSFLETRRDFRGGGPTVSRHYLNNVLTLSFIRDRDTLTDRERERDRSLETSDRGRFSLSLSA